MKVYKWNSLKSSGNLASVLVELGNVVSAVLSFNQMTVSTTFLALPVEAEKLELLLNLSFSFFHFQAASD